MIHVYILFTKPLSQVDKTAASQFPSNHCTNSFLFAGFMVNGEPRKGEEIPRLYYAISRLRKFQDNIILYVMCKTWIRMIFGLPRANLGFDLCTGNPRIVLVRVNQSA